MKTKPLVSIPIVLATLLLVSCGGSPRVTPPAAMSTPTLAAIALTPSTATLQIGSTQQFTGAPTDQFGNPIAVSLTYTSSNAAVATLSPIGLSTGIATGTASITAAANGISSKPATLTVSAVPPVLTSILIEPASAQIPLGATWPYSASGFDQYGNPMSSVSFTFASANPSVVAITSQGDATGLSTGMTSISAAANGVVATMGITVVSLLSGAPTPTTVTSAILVPSAATISVGSSAVFTAGAQNQYGSPIAAAFTFSSSNSAVASVNNGIVTGVGPGTAQVTASASGVTSTPVSITVTTSPPPPSISRLSPPLALVGSTYSIPLTIIGTGFDSNTVVNGFDYPLTPTSVTPAVPPSNVTKLVVTVPQSALAMAATPSVTVSNSNGLSNAMVFHITQQGFVSTPFDDGYQSTYDYGFPLFDKVGMSYTWYIITYKPLLDNSYFATWPEILTVAGRPNAEIGNHTRTHAGVQACPTCPIQFLTLLSDTPTTLSACSPASGSTNGCTPDYSFPIVTTLPDEIIGAQQDLEFMGLKPLTLAYPYGDYDMTPGDAWPPLPFSEQKVETAVQAAGLVGARTTDFCANVAGLPMGQPSECGYGTTEWNPYAIQAFEVNRNSTPTTLAEIQYWTQPALPGHYDPTRQWTIITFHQVQDAAAGYTDTDVDTVDVTLLQSMVDYFIAQNIPVVTMSEGMVILNLNGQISAGAGPSSSVRSTFPRR